MRVQSTLPTAALGLLVLLLAACGSGARGQVVRVGEQAELVRPREEGGRHAASLGGGRGLRNEPAEVVAGRHLAVPGHVPAGRPRQGPGQGAPNLSEPLDHGLLMRALGVEQVVAHEDPREMDVGPQTAELRLDLAGLGEVDFPTSCGGAARKSIQRGVALLHSFGYEEARAAFNEAARADPGCAIAQWGVARSWYHPIWAPPSADELKQGTEAIHRALSAGAKTERERDWINSLAAYYRDHDKTPVNARLAAYTRATEALTRKYPNDFEAWVFHALNLQASAPKDDTTYSNQLKSAEILEKLLAKSPEHPGVVHFLIHAYDYPPLADKGIAAARRYAKLAPAAPHARHMPSHIYIGVGRYADASEANRQAIVADEDYIAQCRAQGIYPLGYYPHNIHFLWFSATMEGRSALAIESAKKTASKATDDAMRQVSILQAFRVAPWYALVRFGKWQEMLNEQAPPADLPMAAGAGVSRSRGSRITRVLSEWFSPTCVSSRVVPPSEIVRRRSTVSSGITVFGSSSTSSRSFARSCAMNRAPASLKARPPAM